MELKLGTWHGVIGITLTLLIFCILFGTTAVAMCRSVKIVSIPFHFNVLLALYSCSFFFVICLFIYTYGYWQESEIYCEVLVRSNFIMQHIAETLIVLMYYLRLYVFFGSNGFYPEWVRYGCWFLVSWPITVGLPVNFCTVKVRIDEKRCTYYDKYDVAAVAWGGLLIPSSFFLLLFLLPIRSSRFQQHIWKQSVKKQIWITLLATFNDIFFALVKLSGSNLHTLALVCFHLAFAVLLSTFIFSDWRRRLLPWKYSSREHIFRRKEKGRSVEDLKFPLMVVDENS